ncbi:unnamed protein product [Rotaria magnacalcarata]|uniref:N-acetylglucosaminylphosphatidylinositol deacetylase n=1 Tax=Rotaria magnacalcarata TaxID=392030 RepID=A0A816SUM8_9BILA|nr:unnamed protein product [Rotaria magnacalcarata]
MISNQILGSSPMWSRALCYRRFVPFLMRSGSTLSNEVSTSQNKSASQRKSDSKYLASDMYNYTVFSHYDIEASMTKYRLTQPSSHAPLKPEPIAPFIFIRLISSKSNEENGNYLLVIAHPDDECLFFSPILLSLHSNKYVLCLSNGNNHRLDELRRSCMHLGVKDFKIIDDQINLKDDQSVLWSSDTILGHVKQSIRQWNISTIISFDYYGVSGHKNHSSIYYALLHLSHNQIHFLSLQSTPIYRKYLTFIELFRIYLNKESTSRRTFVLPVKYSLIPHKAMLEHRSQLIWFRYLYLLFSHYIWINDFVLVY